MLNLPTKWLRVTKAHPCVVCQSDHWCGVSEDGSVCICMRTESPKRAKNGGYVHRLDKPIDRSRIALLAKPVLRPVLNCAFMQTIYVEASKERAVDVFAAGLGLTPESLRRLGIGYSDYLDAWTFPMRDAAGAIVGFRTRYDNGDKRAVTGSRAGLFIPSDLCGFGLLLICEGPTDTAAALTLGFEAIGRPSCRGQEDMIRDYVATRRDGEVWIIADGDEVGRAGARDLADNLCAARNTVRVFSPPQHKDIRAWLQHGVTHQTVTAIAQHRPIWRQR